MFKEEGLIERTWLFQQGIEKGIEQGVEKGAREVLLSLLAARGIKLSTTQRQKIDETHDLEVLQRWAVRAATATTAAAVFTERAKKATRSPRRA